MLLSLALAKLLEAPMCTKRELSGTADSELHMRLWVWGRERRGKDNGDVLITYRR